MRFLKTKVALACKRAQEEKESQLSVESSQTSVSLKSSGSNVSALSTKPFTIIRDNKSTIKQKRPRSKAKESIVSKNIIKNYGKAMATFACSKLSKPYLERITDEGDIDEKGFVHFMATYKECTDSIGGLRSLLLVTEEDSNEVATFKRIFKSLCEIFLKYFAVNWIFGGKMMHKILHLNFRFKMLRRVRNPVYFTYLTSKIK